MLAVHIGVQGPDLGFEFWVIVCFS